MSMSLILAVIALNATVPHFGETLARIYGGAAPGNLANVEFERTDWTDDQKFEIESRPDRVIVRAAGEKGAAYAASRILRELGWRRFAPHRSWEILPKDPPRKLALNVTETPDFRMRSIWFGHGLWPEFRRGRDNGDHKAWNFYARTDGDLVRCGHVYQEFVRREKAFCAEHPECLALVNGERRGSKLCISNPLLRDRFADFIVRRYEENPEVAAVSVEPSDGGGWCECEACAKLGTPTDRAITLANAAVTKLRAKHPGKKVAMYAYNQHSPPPSVQVDRDVIVLVATGFIRGGWTCEKLVEEWGRRTTIGIREYYYNAMFAPGRGALTDSRRLSETIPFFHAKGARYLTGESPDAWAPGLVGFNVAAETLWNVKTDRLSVKRDIVLRAFPSAPKEMFDFFTLIDGGAANPLTSDLIARMRDDLAAAWEKASGTERERVAQMIGYTRYAAKLLAWELSGKPEDVRELLEAAMALKPYYLVHSYSFSRDARPFGASAKALVESFDWKTPRPFEPEKWLGELASFKKLDFTPREFGLDLVPAPRLSAAGAPRMSPVRGRRSFHLWSDGRPFDLTVTGGLIPHYRNRGNVKLSLVQIGGESETGELETEVFHDESVPPDGERRVVRIVPKRPGLHRLDVSDGFDRTEYAFPTNLPMAIAVTSGKGNELSGDFWFYVPKGVKTLGFFAKTDRGRICGPDGKEIASLAKRGDFDSIPVPDGADGCLWCARNMRGVFRPLTVPSLLFPNPSSIIIPKGL